MKSDLLKNIEGKSLVLQSVAIWLIDNSKYYPKKYNRLDKLKLSVLFYMVSILAFFVVLSDSFLRLIVYLFKKKDSFKNISKVKIGFVYFANSHLLVLEKLIEELDPNERILISSKTFKELFKHQDKNSTFYVDYMVNASNISRTIRDVVNYILTERKATVNFFQQMSGFDKILFRRLIIKIFFSLRFKNLTNTLYSKFTSIDRIILGNDSCYRSFWLINFKTPKKKSCTIQHGIPENLIQYYSISDFFMAWDYISLGRLIKNKRVHYDVCGYPKKNQFFGNSNKINDSILIVVTKTSDEYEIIQLKKIISLLETEKLEVYIKLHPLETKEVVLQFRQNQIFKSNKFDEFSNHMLILVDTTLALDLKYSGLNFLPLTFDFKRTFNLYFESIHIDDFISEFPKGSIKDYVKKNESRFKSDIHQNNFQLKVFKTNAVI